MPRRYWILAALAGALLLLQGCGGVRDALGLSKRQPDEFAVVRRQPLIMPPDYSLRAPQPGVEGPQIGSAREQARATLTGEAAAEGAPAPVAPRPAASGRPSEGQSALLAHAGGDAADPEIRRKIAQDADALQEADPTLLGRLLGWQRPGPQDPVLDPAAESERLSDERREAVAASGTAEPTVLRREQNPIDLEQEQ